MEEEKNNATNLEKADPSTNRKNHTSLIALIILVLVVAIGFRGYYFYKQMKTSNPVKVTANLIKDFGNSSKEELKDLNKFFDGKKPYILTIDGKVNDISFKTESGVDLKNKVVTFLANLSGMGDLKIDGTLKSNSLFFKFSEDGNAYKLDQDFSQVLESVDDYNNNLGIDTSKKITGYLADSIEESLKKTDFTEKKDDVEVSDGEKVKATIYEIEINNEKMANILSTFIDKIVKDDELMNSYVKTAQLIDPEITKDKIISTINESKGQLKDAFNGLKLKYAIAVYKGDIVSLSLSNNEISLVYTNYNDNKKVIYTANDENIKVIAYDAKEEAGFKLISKENPIDLKYNKKDFSYILKVNNMEFLTGTYKTNESANAAEVSLTFNSAIASGSLSLKLELVDSLKEKTYDNALDIKEEENLSRLMEEIQSNPFIGSIGELLENLIPSQDSWDSLDGFDL